MDSQSLDSCLQKTLSSLYHPFESTAATVLCQVLDVVEKTFRGDGLSYLIDFLIPAKRILQGLQQEACLQYRGLLFRHAGWPLCIHDKIVLQLASIDWRLLQPGDFYLQVVPYLRKTPRIVLKCLAPDQHNIEEIVLPEVSYSSIFTSEWLEFVNSERFGSLLENCLLTCDDQLHRVPWDMIVHPEFVEKKQSTEESAEISNRFLLHESKEGSTRHPGEDLMVQDEKVVLEPPSTSHGHTRVNTLDVKTEIEGEYVELRDIKVPRFGPVKGSLTQSIALNFKSQRKSHQRSNNNQTLSIRSSNYCAERFIHSRLQPSDTENIMGASVTHYATDRVHKPETIGLVDIEFGVGGSSIPDCTRVSFDNGSKDFQQAFSLENEALSGVSEDATNNVINETDNGRRRCERPSPEPDNYSTSLSFQEESRSHFRQFTDDARGVTDASQEPVTEHSRTHFSLVIEDVECSNQDPSKPCVPHRNTEDSDRMVPLLPDNANTPPENTDNLEDSESADVVEGSGSADVVEGSGSADVVEGSGSADVVEGSGSADVVEGSGSADVVEGSESADVVERSESADVVEGSESADVVERSESADVVEGSGSADVVEGSESADVVEGSGSADVVEGSGSADVVEGSRSADVVEGSGSADVVEGSGSADVVEGSGSADVVEGSESADVVERSESADVVEGSGSADVVEGSGSADVVEGSGSADVVEGSGSADVVEGSGSADVVEGSGSADVVEGSGSADVVEGSGSADVVEGSGSADVVEGSGSADVVEGSGSADVESSGSADVVEGSGSADVVEGSGSADVEGSERADVVEGSERADVVEGSERADVVEGSERADVVEGSERADVVEGSEKTNGISFISREVIDDEVYVAQEGAHSGEFSDQDILVVSDIGQGQGLTVNTSDEQINSEDAVTMNGSADDLSVPTMEQTKLELPYSQMGYESPPISPQYTKRAHSPATQLPLETLHEDTEEEQGATTDDPPDVSVQNVTVRGQTNDQQKRPEILPERDPSPLWRHGLSSPGVCRRSESQTCPWRVRDVNIEVLMSGVVYLPGTRDRSGRSLVIINTRDTCWLNPHCNASELGRLFLYFYSTVRRDSRALGLTLLVDARRCSPVPALFKAIHIVQVAIPHCIHGVLLLTEKDLVLSLERPHGVQFDVLTSAKSFHKHIEASQLPPTFNGTFPYCHQDWLTFRTKLENLQDNCRDACVFLHNAIQNMHVNPLPDTAEEASLQLTRFGQLMKTVLEDTRLVTLQTEGGAVLARLRKEESCVTLTDDYREAMDIAAELYNRVDEGVHSLVRLSNQRIQEMELVIDFEAFEERFQEVSGWIENVGERLLEECGVLEDSLEVLLQTQRHFSEFDGVACKYCRQGQELLQSMDRWQNLSSPDVQKFMIRLQKCKEKVVEFSWGLEECRSRLEKTVRLYQFFDKAYEWALDGMRHLAAISLDDCNSPELCLGAIEGLEKYQAQHPVIGEKKFEEMRELAYELKSDKGVKQWKFAWSKCQEARQVFEKKLEAALRAKSSPSGEQNSLRSRLSEVGDQKVHSDKNMNVSYIQNKLLNSPVCGRERRLGRVLCHRPEMDLTPFRVSPPGSSTSSIASSSYRVRKLSLQSSSGEDLRLDLVHQVPSGSSTPTPSRPMGRRLLRKAQSFDLPGTDVSSHGCQRRLSEPARRGNTGVFIKGLEVSSTELAERPCSPRQPLSTDWSAERMMSDRRSSVSSADGRCRSSKLRHIIDEMVTTEREYVRSLWYISENYFPEMDRTDLPQDLRGKRGIIFGNLEKLRDFHSQYFLKELESCCNHPLRVSHCFLRHKDQFGMYALYSKNKPRSDLLLASHGNIFFKNKQRQLGDKMDLASYLLKPIQRMSKYALLLKDLIKECGEAQEQELAYLRAAEEMVKFQLRHGNDLLAMDAIRDCDVNLKEQGQLVRQGEFTVWLGRKKCQRHVFLFEDLILFSKPKRIEGGLDVYIYKRSFKTADIGLTENSGDSGLRFEIWFRRRKSNDTHILQANTAEIRHAWTADIAKILWQQANRNKEIRIQEMVSMGVGNKPFLDIKPSDAAINNRAIDYIMKGRGARTRASIAVSLFDHSDPYKRTPAPITCNSVPSAGGPSSASLLGPLNLHMYVNQTLLPGVLSPNRTFETSSCLEEDELENETSCSQPSMTTESSESSHCMSGAGSSGSDSGCVSSIPQDNMSEDAGSPCDASAKYNFPERRNRSSVISPIVEKPRFINRQYISAV
ncbi:rho guanine nucleotide exchange factor 40-like isoform X2 [Rhinoderma darwinii]|uniref:rho guanine nucleotide exchange factor 40-like isoform X2 n=1 Tax=Rhinoderma darwinii TaxID=43563 RepID=UPI003F675D14